MIQKKLGFGNQRRAGDVSWAGYNFITSFKVINWKRRVWRGSSFFFGGCPLDKTQKSWTLTKKWQFKVAGLEFISWQVKASPETKGWKSQSESPLWVSLELLLKLSLVFPSILIGDSQCPGTTQNETVYHNWFPSISYNLSNVISCIIII